MQVIPEAFTESVMLRIRMDIRDQSLKISLAACFLPAIRLFKKASGALVPFIDCLGIGIDLLLPSP